MRVTVPIDDLPDDQDELPPGQREVPEGWHLARVVRCQEKDGTLSVAYELPECGRAWLWDSIDSGDERGRMRLVRLARACGQTGEVETDDLVGRDLEVRCKHGGLRDRPPPTRWQNVAGVRALHRAAEPPSEEDVGDTPF